MKKNILKTIALMLLSTSVCHSYTEVGVACKVNNAQLTAVSCDDGWVSMRSYREVELRLRDCSSSRSRQKIEVRIDNIVYRPNSLSNLEIKFRVDDKYVIECFDSNRFTSF